MGTRKKKLAFGELKKKEACSLEHQWSIVRAYVM
jgi:hypothetical protein